MISKKLATTLGTGTLGAGGAGAAAWNLGLFGGNGLEVNEVNDANQQLKEVPEKLKQSPAGPREPQEGLVENQGNDGRGSRAHGGTNTGPGGGYVAPVLHFAGATDWDKKAISQDSEITWSSTISGSGEVSVTISTSQVDSNNWRCELKAIIFGNASSVDKSEFKRQGKELVEKIKSNGHQRTKFVENCSKARTEIEKEDEATSKIYLETEKTNAPESKFKFKDQDIQKLLNEDFTGVYKLGEDEESVLSNRDLTPETLKKEGKVIIKSVIAIIPEDEENMENVDYKDWICYISGGPKNKKDFKDDKLKEILNTFGSIPSENAEKKKYILRNCMKNNKDIKGLEFKEEGDSWKLDDDSLKKITEGMYENPPGEKP